MLLFVVSASRRCFATYPSCSVHVKTDVLPVPTAQHRWGRRQGHTGRKRWPTLGGHGQHRDADLPFLSSHLLRADLLVKEPCVL